MTQSTLREQLSDNYDKIVGDGTPDAPLPETPAAVDTAAPAPEVEAKDTETPQRERDEAGRFAKSDKPEKKADAEKAKPVKESVAPEVKAQPAPAPAAPKLAPPSSWKKDYWQDWERIDPRVAQYIKQREDEFVRGVSAYKGEAENARAIIEALAPHQQLLQSAGMRPEQFVSQLANAHRSLSDPQRRMSAFVQLARDYQIPLGELFVQGEDGKIYFNQQHMQAQQQAQAPNIDELEKRIFGKLQQQQLVEKLRTFIEAKDASGNPLHPHFEEVRTTMDGLLRSGLAKDFDDAYQQSLRLPRHEALYEAQQRQEREHKEAAEKARQAAVAARARQNAVSTRSAAPQAEAQAGSGKKDLRSQLSDNYDAIMNGRV